MRNFNHRWNHFLNDSSDDDEPRRNTQDPPRQLTTNRRTYIAPDIPTDPPRTQRRVTRAPDGTERYTEVVNNGSMPFWNAYHENQQAQMDNEYDLRELEAEVESEMRRDRWDHEFSLEELQQTNARLQQEIAMMDAQLEREHQENLRRIEQTQPVMEQMMKMIDLQNRHDMLREQYRNRQQRVYHDTYAYDDMRDGTRLLEQRKQLFKDFGFTEDDAKYPNEPRFSDHKVIPSMFAKYSNYRYSLLVTGANVVNVDNPFNAFVTFVDGNVMELPTGFNGFQCYKQRIGGGTYLIHVCYHGAEFLKQYFRVEYIKARYCCNKCNVQ